MLSEEQRQRYAKHLLLPEVGEKGQEKLLAAKVLIVGAGGLGSPVALYLAAAGVGTLGIIDGDTVEPSNLQRQIVHKTASVGKLKVDSVQATLAELNPDVQVIAYPEYATAENLPHILAYYDLVVDCCDNLATRYLVNDVAVLYHKPYVYGSIMRFDGQAAVLYPPAGPCYRCLFPETQSSSGLSPSQDIGVLGITPGLVGMVQATEALKLILGIGESLNGQLLVIDALKMEIMKVKIARDPDCVVCGDRPTILDLVSENYLSY
ncbi:MAG TPA: molybdopterin-synthase adenylyltransferase MoeB [Oscillospiraceae bacterium]|nr:molybdopterin-synthase adenylyltransferase MoeB [Oscillospiraceae bacterium]